jgi:transglutaminase-like putative cysteine protease
VRSAARPVAAAVPAGLVVAVAWLRLEHPLAPLWRPAALVVLALAPALVRRRSLRASAAVLATVAAAWVSLGISLLPSRPLDPGAVFGLADPVDALGTHFSSGFADFYGTQLPFDPRVHVQMGQLVLAALFCFTLLVALLAAARRPVAAALVLVAGAGWPATLLGTSYGIATGAAILAASLGLFAGLGSRRIPAVALPAIGAVVLASVTVGSAAAARQGLVHWQTWDPTGSASGPVGVGFVWDARYGGLHWPQRHTVVLEVRAPKPPRFLRATVLDEFVGDAWVSGIPRAADSLEPPAALRPGNQTREVVTVERLADTHLVGGSIPIRYGVGGAPVVEPVRGFGTLPGGLAPGFRYTVWSYAPRVTAAALRRSPPNYPVELARDGMLGVGDGVNVPPFGTPHRLRSVLADLAHEPHLALYMPLVRLAEQVAGGAATPYDAVAALERWFLESGGFKYSNDPRVVGPPLVGFVTRTRAGYCQYFAGAMALMLRYLGIPARVAAGFWGGTYDAHRRAWVVTDHDAHAWVEVWFRGYGWLPLDPTPAAAVSVRTPTVPGAERQPGGLLQVPGLGLFAQAAAGAHAPAEGTGRGEGGALRDSHLRRRSGSAAAAAVSSDRRGEIALVILLVAGASVGGIVLTKRGVTSIRRLPRAPRRVAAACREELAAFLLDQRIEPAASATLNELGELVRQVFGADTRRFVAATTAARFGRIEHAEAAAREARRELRDLLDIIRGGLSRRERLLGLLSLRSLVRRRPPVDTSASLGRRGILGGTGS